MSGEISFSDRRDTHQIEESNEFAPKFDENGVLPVVTTDAATGEVLMLAYMNKVAVAKTIETGQAHYWSRSRGKLWIKGETSGNTQKVIEMRTDCDQDAIWLKVDMGGSGASCHVGYRSCFYRSIPLGQTPTPQLRLEFKEDSKSFDPDKVYRNG